MWFSVLFTIAFLYIFHLYYNSIRALFLSRNTRGPRAYPIIGSAACFLNKTSAGILFLSCNKPQSENLYQLKRVYDWNVFSMVLFAEIFQIGVGLTKQYGFFFKFWLGPELKYTVQDPKDIEVSGYKSLQNKENYKNTCFCFEIQRLFWAAWDILTKHSSIVSLDLG